MVWYQRPLLNFKNLIKNIKEFLKKTSKKNLVEYILIYVLMINITYLYMRYMYTVYLYLFIIFTSLIIFSYTFNIKTIFKINLNYFKFLNWTNFLAFIIINYFIKLPIFFIYLQVYNMINFWKNKKKLDNWIYLLLNFFIKTLFNFILNMPLFILISSFEWVSIYYLQKTNFQTKNKWEFFNSIINQHVFKTIVFYSLSVNDKKIIINNNKIELNPHKKNNFIFSKNPQKLNLALKFLIKNTIMKYGKFNILKINHANYIYLLKKNILNNYNLLAHNNTSSPYLKGDVKNNFWYYGYKTQKHSITPVFFQEKNNFIEDQSQEARSNLYNISNEPKQLILVVLSFIKGYNEKIKFYNEKGELIDSNYSLKDLCNNNDFDVFINDFLNEAVKEINNLSEDEWNYINTTEADIIIQDFISENLNWLFSDELEHDKLS